MISTGEKCTMCHGPMSDAKPAVEGPKKGLARKICKKCGHIKYLPAEPHPLGQPPPRYI